MSNVTNTTMRLVEARLFHITLDSSPFCQELNTETNNKRTNGDQARMLNQKHHEEMRSLRIKSKKCTADQ